MNLILCLDNRGGMLFNHRRLSRDVAVSQRCLSLATDAKLHMNAYSYKLFEGCTGSVHVAEDFLSNAGELDFCFVETQLPGIEKVNRIYVFRWNRDYPSDVRFDPENVGFTLVSAEDFPGNTHPVITLEIYER